MKRHGIALSLWEVFTLFEYLNTVVAKQVFYEPQRYHACLWEHFHQLITGQNDYRTVLEKRMKPGKKTKKGKRDDALSLAESLNKSSESSESSDEFSSQESDAESTKQEDLSKLRKRNAGKPCNQIKHTFDINVTSLQQIPLLAKHVTQSQDHELSTQSLPQSSNYIQTVAVKYSFPLDEDEIYESDYIKKNPKTTDDHTIYDFDVSMNTVHTYKLGQSDTIGNHLSKGNLFNISLVVYCD